MAQGSPINEYAPYGDEQPPWLISESNGHCSREEVTLVAHELEWPSGLVLGKHTTGGAYAPHDPGGSDGLDAAAAILMHPSPAQGVATTATYDTATIQGGEVTAIPQLTGGAHYAYGASYTLTPTGGTPETPCEAHAIGQADGTLGPAIITEPGVGYDTAPTIAAEAPPAVPTTKATVIVRRAEVHYDLLEWDASCDTTPERDAAMADMAVKRIIRR